MQLYKSAVAALVIGSLAVGGCSATSNQDVPQQQANSAKGEIGMALVLPDDSTISTVLFGITGPGGFARSGSVPVDHSSKIAFRVGKLPVQNGFNIALSATNNYGQPCAGNANFDILDATTTSVTVALVCQATDVDGDLIVGVDVTSCPLVTTLQALPAEAYVETGASMALTAGISHGDSAVTWSAPSGTFTPTTGYDTTFVCTVPGLITVTATVTGAGPKCNNALTMTVECTKSPGCGNGTVDPGEACDDGNAVNTDDCTNNCAVGTCGDGIVKTTAPAEECDDGDGVDTDACSNACTANVCGNGRKDPGEDCDDGNTVNGDTCPSTCKTAVCGDGVVSGSEQCDDSNTVNTDTCVACANAFCGDGFVEAGVEGCDDHNTASGDGCSATCTVEAVIGDAPQQIAACKTCRAQHCQLSGDDNGYDVVDLCFSAGTVNPDTHTAVDAAFVQKCVDLRNCMYSNHSGFDPNVGPLASYCGTVPDATCAATGGNGPCVAQWGVALGTTIPSEIGGQLGNTNLPGGIAYTLTVCDVEYCTACVP